MTLNIEDIRPTHHDVWFTIDYQAVSHVQDNTRPAPWHEVLNILHGKPYDQLLPTIINMSIRATIRNQR
jgi:hypothetical protein